jgi:hypothetical protein
MVKRHFRAATAAPFASSFDPGSRANILDDDRNPNCHPDEDGLFETSLFQDRFTEFIKRFEVERQGLLSALDGLFVGFSPRIAAFERWKIGQIALGVPLDRETKCSEPSAQLRTALTAQI